MTTRFACHPCGILLTADDREHYLYHCHDCAMEEHDLIVAVARDPDHPDAHRLELSPVELAPRAAPSKRPRGAARQLPVGSRGLASTGVESPARLSSSRLRSSASRRRRSAS